MNFYLAKKKNSVEEDTDQNHRYKSSTKQEETSNNYSSFQYPQTTIISKYQNNKII